MIKTSRPNSGLKNRSNIVSPMPMENGVLYPRSNVETLPPIQNGIFHSRSNVESPISMENGSVDRHWTRSEPNDDD